MGEYVFRMYWRPDTSAHAACLLLLHRQVFL